MAIFNELVFVIVLAVSFGFLAHLLRQPVIVGFIAAGLVIGYFEKFELTQIHFIETLGSLGIALLLFLVGLEMNFGEWKRVNLLALLAGLGQIVFTFVAGFFVSVALGFSNLSAIYIAAALTLSSTIVVVKLLSEKKDLRSLYGRVVVAILLLQDFAAILLLLFLTGLTSDGAIGFQGFTALYKVLGLLIFVAL